MKIKPIDTLLYLNIDVLHYGTAEAPLPFFFVVRIEI
jgi:hypothetical protein